MSMTRRSAAGGLILAASLLGLPARADDEPPAQEVFRAWTGRLNVGSVSLRLRFVITDAKSARVISLDQGNAEIPATEVRIRGKTVTLIFSPIQAKFEGEVKGDRIEGTFTQGGAIPLTLTRGETVADAPPAEALTQDGLNSLRRTAGVPALIAGYHRRGGQPVILFDGIRSVEADRPVTAGDRCHWGSITKSMTSTVAARLIEAGKIRWTATVGDILGSKGPIRDAYKTATLLHLLSHRAGLQPNLPVTEIISYSRDELPDARSERLKYALTALGQDPQAPLGQQMIYSNNGYIIAGAMLETVTGQPWEQLIRNELFNPLTLKSAGFGAPGTLGRIDQPLGHAMQGDLRIPAKPGPGGTNDNPVALGPAGRVHMTVGDMLTYLAAHRDQPESYLKPESWKTLHTPHFGGDYALGWSVRQDGTLWHNGSNTLWYAEVMFNPETGVAAAAVGNDAAPQTQRAVGAIAASAYAAGLKV